MTNTEVFLQLPQAIQITVVLGVSAVAMTVLWIAFR